MGCYNNEQLKLKLVGNFCTTSNNPWKYNLYK